MKAEDVLVSCREKGYCVVTCNIRGFEIRETPYGDLVVTVLIDLLFVGNVMALEMLLYCCFVSI